MKVQSKWHNLSVKLSYFSQIKTTNSSSGTTAHNLKTQRKLAAKTLNTDKTKCLAYQNVQGGSVH